MSLVGNDKYMLKENRTLNMAQMDSLMNLYQPLLSSLAICLYLTLLNMPIKTNKIDTHNSLCTKLKCSIDKLEEARIELEHFSLLRCFVSKANRSSLYLYEIQSPLAARKFLKHDIYSRLLMQVMGKGYVKSFYDDINNSSAIDGLEEITSVMFYPAEQWTNNDEKDYQKLVSKLPIVNTKQSEIYDFKRFTIEHNISEFIVPISSMTSDDISLINLYGAKYQINKDEMLKIFQRCFNRETGLIVRDKFLNNCIRSANRQKTINIEDKSYNMEPSEFIMYLLPPREMGLTNYEINDLEKIRKEYKFKTDLLNFVLEKTYNNTLDHSLPYNYMDKVAKTLQDAKVKTIEEANALYSDKNDFYKFKKKDMIEAKPIKTKSYRHVEQIPDYKKSKDFVGDVDINQTRDKLKALLKKGGK